MDIDQIERESNYEIERIKLETISNLKKSYEPKIYSHLFMFCVIFVSIFFIYTIPNLVWLVYGLIIGYSISILDVIISYFLKKRKALKSINDMQNMRMRAIENTREKEFEDYYDEYDDGVIDVDFVEVE